jgi:hypothetical protein
LNVTGRILESGKAPSLVAGRFEVSRVYGFASWPGGENETLREVIRAAGDGA